MASREALNRCAIKANSQKPRERIHMTQALYKNKRIIKTKEGYIVGQLTFKTLEEATRFID